MDLSDRPNLAWAEWWGQAARMVADVKDRHPSASRCTRTTIEAHADHVERRRRPGKGRHRMDESAELFWTVTSVGIGVMLAAILWILTIPLLV